MQSGDLCSLESVGLRIVRAVGIVNYSSLQLSDRLTAACEAQKNPRPCIPLYCTCSNTSNGTPSVTPLLKGVPNHTECAAFRLLIYIGFCIISVSPGRTLFVFSGYHVRRWGIFRGGIYLFF